MKRHLVLVLFSLSIGTAFSVTPEDCEDSEFHLDPDDCPSSYFRCYSEANGDWRIEKHTCPADTGFNPAIGNCDWDYNLPSGLCDDITHKPTPPTTKPPPTTTTEFIPGGNKRLVCYFGAWAFYRPGEASFDIDDIDPNLCTHLCYGFANMNNHTWKANAYDPWFDLAPWDEGCDGDHCHWDSFRRFTKLKEKNPALKTLLSIGGWNTGSGQWSQMAIDPMKRKTFIDSAVMMAETFNFDGIDFDWEYPGDRQGSDIEHDKEDFTALVEEFAAALHAKSLILTAATSPDFERLDLGMDLPRVVEAIDFINVMGYDYHGAWDNFTGLNTPLYGRNDEGDADHPGYRFNINDTINYYIERGADPLKLNLGIASYGRGFTLPDNTNDNGVYCQTVGPIPSGHITHEAGMWSYYEVLEALTNETLTDLPGAVPKQWETIIDGCYKAPYSINGPYWIGYDTEESVALKAQYANYRGLGGAMMFALDLDDWSGRFGSKYPLTSKVKEIMRTGESLDPEDIIGDNSSCMSAPACEYVPEE